jgi:hypothetical protein
MYELGILDDGTLVGIPPSLMETSLRTLELMAAELGATVMVLRVVKLTSPPVMSGRLGMGVGVGISARDLREKDKDKYVDKELRKDEVREGDTAGSGERPYKAPRRRSGLTQFQQEKLRRANLTGNQRGSAVHKNKTKNKHGLGPRGHDGQVLTAKQRKRLEKREVYDSDSESQEDGNGLEVGNRADVGNNANDPVDIDADVHKAVLPVRTLEVNGRIYGPDEDWPVLRPEHEQLDPVTATAPGTQPASWKERNLAQYALASTADGKWKAKREYGQAEKELIRRERRERKRARKTIGKSGDGNEGSSTMTIVRKRRRIRMKVEMRIRRMTTRAGSSFSGSLLPPRTTINRASRTRDPPSTIIRHPLKRPRAPARRDETMNAGVSVKSPAGWISCAAMGQAILSIRTYAN